MPDTTPNYGFQIPKLDGTDFINPDIFRQPMTDVDTEIKRLDDNVVDLSGLGTKLKRVPGGVRFTAPAGGSANIEVNTNIAALGFVTVTGCQVTLIAGSAFVTTSPAIQVYRVTLTTVSLVLALKAGAVLGAGQFVDSEVWISGT